MAMRDVDGFTAWKREVDLKRRADPLQVFAFLLYSRVNKRLFDFVHEFYFTLDDLTGDHFTVFVIWSALLKDHLGGPDAMAEVSSKFTPYNLARKFGIKTQKIPCFVFFRNIDDKDVIVYRLNDEWETKDLLDEFERLTDDVEKAREKAEGKRNPYGSLWKSLERTLKAREWMKGALERTTTIKPILEIIKTLLGFISK